jgi:hypothetical protein
MMHGLMCMISGARRKPRFSQATLKKPMDGLSQQPVSAAFCPETKELSPRRKRFFSVAPQTPYGAAEHDKKGPALT